MAAIVGRLPVTGTLMTGLYSWKISLHSVYEIFISLHLIQSHDILELYKEKELRPTIWGKAPYHY